MNVTNLVGRITKDPEIKYTTEKNIPVCNFSLAVPNKYNREQTNFIPCQIWSKGAELMEKYVKKGHRLGVTGALQSSTYDKDGVTHYKLELNLDDLEFLEPKSSE